MPTIASLGLLEYLMRTEKKLRKDKLLARRYGAQGVVVRGNREGNGAAGWDRTSDPWLRRPILYPLSYSRAGGVTKDTVFPQVRPWGAVEKPLHQSRITL